jgi:hypothetical protein
LAPLQIHASLYEGPIYLLYVILLLLLSHHLLIQAPVGEHYGHFYALSIVNVVYIVTGSMIEHDGLGIAFFSIFILKDMIVSWYA